MKKFALIAALLLIPAAASAQHEHDCDTPISHAQHGTNECGNVDDLNLPHTTVCQNENVKINGTIWNAEYLVCGPSGSSSGGPGCSYQFIVRCGEQIRSGEISFGLSYDGSMPACSRSPLAGPGIPQQRGYVCTSRTSSSQSIVHACYCRDDGQLGCI